jgi:hypothetical protein
LSKNGWSTGSIIAHVAGDASLISVVRCGIATFLADVIDELDDLAQTVKIQQVWGDRRRIEVWRSGVIGRAHGDGGVKTVRESDDKVRVSTPADADDFDLLAA